MTTPFAKLPLVWLVGVLLACLSIAVGYQIGKVGDCDVGQIDGQCGLSTFIGLFSGVIVGVVVLMCAAVYTIVCVFRHRKERISVE